MVVIWSDWKRYLLDRGKMQCQGNFKIGWLKEEINLLAAKFPPRRPPYCLLRFSRQHNARVILTLPLSEMYATVGFTIACDRLRLYGNNSLCDRLRSALCDPRSSAIVCDRLGSYGNQMYKTSTFQICFDCNLPFSTQSKMCSQKLFSCGWFIGSFMDKLLNVSTHHLN